MHMVCRTAAVAAAFSVASLIGGAALAQQSRTLTMQSAVPPTATSQEGFKFFAERVDKLTGGSLKINALPGGALVPPFEILDAAHKKVLDGAYGISYWWYGKSATATLFSNTPAGIFGMDAVDFIGWVYEGGGLDLWNEAHRRAQVVGPKARGEAVWAVVRKTQGFGRVIERRERQYGPEHFVAHDGGVGRNIGDHGGPHIVAGRIDLRAACQKL